ncbi:MAG: ErfK/YbiS/YcfS/YnhG family protein [Chloroflexi bacterium]|nr:ErfK/YbiS/YcfS/YnhG family protein [Chloroflexota bacterium]
MSGKLVARLAGVLAALSASAVLLLPIEEQGSVAPLIARAAPSSQSFGEFWVATHSPSQAWSAPSADATAFGPISVGSPLKVLAPGENGRLFVMNPATNSVAWVDAAAVGPIPTPTDAQLAEMLDPPTPAAYEAWWAMTHRDTTAWSGPMGDALPWGEILQWRFLRVVQPAEGERVLAVDPRSESYVWVDLDAIGAVGPPPGDYFGAPPADDATIGLPGRIVGTVDSFERPARVEYFSLNRHTNNESVSVEGLIDRGDNERWYRLSSNEYVPTSNVRLPQPPDRTWAGRWIDASLTEPVMVTAYEGTRPLYSALAVKGATAFQTPTGIYQINRRVQNERNSPNGYLLKDVLYTQYFTNDGAALHYNYWRSDWGSSGSKGCLGMNLVDSKFFWDFATVGTVVYIHQ